MVTYPFEWTVDSLNNVAKLFDNLRIPVTKSLRTPGNIPYYGANGIQDFVSGYTHEGEFVLIAEDGANDLLNYPVTYVGGKVWVNNHAHVLAGNQSITDTKFLSYLLKKVDYSAILVGGTRAKLNGKVLRNVEITFPEKIPEQQAIASVLSDIDEHIDNLTELIEKKKAIRDGALEDLISGMTRLEGFHGDWTTLPFSQYFSMLPTNTYSREQLSDSGEIGNIHYGDVLIKYGCVLSENDCIPRVIDTSKLNAKHYLRKNDVIIADTAEDDTVGKAVQVGEIGMPLVSGLHTMACRPNYPTADGFLGYYINSNCYHDQLLPYITGIKVSSISKKAIGDTFIRIPMDIKEQETISSVLTVMDEEIEALEEEKAKMIGIKEGAMDDLLTGRVRLKV